MEVRVAQVGGYSAEILIVERDDGVNPPGVIELSIMETPQSRDTDGPSTYRVELRTGTAVEFAEHEDDAESFPETIFCENVTPEAHVATETHGLRDLARVARTLQDIYDRADANQEWPDPEAVANLTIELCEGVRAIAGEEE